MIHCSSKRRSLLIKAASDSGLDLHQADTRVWSDPDGPPAMGSPLIFCGTGGKPEWRGRAGPAHRVSPELGKLLWGHTPFMHPRVVYTVLDFQVCSALLLSLQACIMAFAGQSF